MEFCDKFEKFQKHGASADPDENLSQLSPKSEERLEKAKPAFILSPPDFVFSEEVMTA